MTSKKTLNVIARAMKRKKENDEVEAALIFIQPVCGGFICRADASGFFVCPRSVVFRQYKRGQFNLCGLQSISRTWFIIDIGFCVIDLT